MVTETLTRTAGITDQAVLAKTGKTWEQWCRILDAAGCRSMDHKSIARFVRGSFTGVGGWWSQMVTVGYEQARGLRKPHETAKGFAVNVSRTISAPLPKLYAAWRDKRRRAAWLSKPEFTLRKSTPNKSMRITWVDKSTSVEVNFYAKGTGKSQVVVQHSRLPGEAAVRRMRGFWSKELDKLKSVLAA